METIKVCRVQDGCGTTTIAVCYDEFEANNIANGLNELEWDRLKDAKQFFPDVKPSFTYTVVTSEEPECPLCGMEAK